MLLFGNLFVFWTVLPLNFLNTIPVTDTVSAPLLTYVGHKIDKKTMNI